MRLNNTNAVIKKSLPDSIMRSDCKNMKTLSG